MVCLARRHAGRDTLRSALTLHHPLRASPSSSLASSSFHSPDLDTFLRQGQSAHDAGYSHDVDDPGHQRSEMEDLKMHDD